jgi:hypothetical protein
VAAENRAHDLSENTHRVLPMLKDRMKFVPQCFRRAMMPQPAAQNLNRLAWACQCGTAAPVAMYRRRNDARMTHLAFALRQHRSVSACSRHWEYAVPSVRDMASFAFLSARLA